MQRYRRRDLRNSLASRMGLESNFREENDSSSRVDQEPSKQRVKFTNVPLDVSDYVLEDMVKEFGEPIYSNFYDSKDNRTAVFELEDASVMKKIVEKYDTTDLNGSQITVQIFEQQRKQDRHRKQRGGRKGGRGNPGSHYSSNREGRSNIKSKPATLQDLDAELEEYMNN